MNHIGGVHVEDSPEELVDEVLDVLVSELLSAVDHSVHVSLHQVVHHVDVWVPCAVVRLHHVQQGNYVLVVKEPEELYFSEDSFCVD